MPLGQILQQRGLTPLLPLGVENLFSCFRCVEVVAPSCWDGVCPVARAVVMARALAGMTPMKFRRLNMGLAGRI